MAVQTCDDFTGIYGSLSHCEGAPVEPGIRRKAYFISKRYITAYPALPAVAKCQMNKVAVTTGSYTLAMEQKWKRIDLLDTAQITFKTDGEYPEATVLNEAELPYAAASSEEAAGFAALAANDDLVILVQQADGKWRILGGSEFRRTKLTVEAGSGKVEGGGSSYLIKVSARDRVPAPFYTGTIDAEEGTIECGPSPEVP